MCAVDNNPRKARIVRGNLEAFFPCQKIRAGLKLAVLAD